MVGTEEIEGVDFGALLLEGTSAKIGVEDPDFDELFGLGEVIGIEVLGDGVDAILDGKRLGHPAGADVFADADELDMAGAARVGDAEIVLTVTVAPEIAEATVGAVELTVFFEAEGKQEGFDNAVIEGVGEVGGTRVVEIGAGEVAGDDETLATLAETEGVDGEAVG